MYDEDNYEKIKTPKELYEAIRLELKWEGPFAFETPGDGIPELIQTAIRIRAENLPLDLGTVPTKCTVPDIQNWCINAQKVMAVAAAKGAEIAQGATAEATQDKPGDAGDSAEKAWLDDAPDYMPNSEAIVTFTNNKMSLSTLSKLLTPNGSIRYMRKRGKGCKVYIADFAKYARLYYPPDAVVSEYVDEMLTNIETEKAEMKRHKNRTGNG